MAPTTKSDSTFKNADYDTTSHEIVRGDPKVDGPYLDDAQIADRLVYDEMHDEVQKIKKTAEDAKEKQLAEDKELAEKERVEAELASAGALQNLEDTQPDGTPVAKKATSKKSTTAKKASASK